MTRTTLSFHDIAHGAQYARGWWVLTRTSELDDLYEEIGRRADGEDRRLEGRCFVRYHAVTAQDVLAIARSIDPQIVAVLDSSDEEMPGWTCLYERLAPDANARKWPDSYAEYVE